MARHAIGEIGGKISVPRTQRSAPFFTAWCAAEPGSRLLTLQTGVPVLRSGMKNAASRPEHETSHLHRGNHHPRNPELVDAHPKTLGKEGGREGHGHHAAFGERL